jgi:hypothetical protein
MSENPVETDALMEARGAILTALMVPERKDMNAAQIRALVMPAVEQVYRRAEQALAAAWEVVETYESCGPKRQSTRDVLAAVRAALERGQSDA